MDPYVFLFWLVLTFAMLLGLVLVFAPKLLGGAAARPAMSPTILQRFTAPAAAVFGIGGAFLLATKLPPALGFGAFLLSNIGWIVVSYRARAWCLLVQQLCFLVASVIGLWNWGLGPLLLG